jgi:hypothetical protein
MFDFVLYTHTDCKDVWPIFFGQTKKYEKNLNKVIFVNKKDDDIPSDYKVVLYDDTKVYRERLLNCLNQIETDYMLFQHEDMFLYKNAQWDKILSYKRIMMDNNIDIIKLIRGGNEVGQNFSLENPELKVITKDFPYIFAIQPSLFKTDSFVNIVTHSKGDNIWQFEIGAQKACRDLNIKALYVDDGGIKRGKAHWDSNIYPYVATAVVKGKWNMSEYKNELTKLLNDYEISHKNRGAR